MSDKQPTLGKLLDGPAERDAIHVAIAPVVASDVLSPGQHVGFVASGNSELVGKSDTPVGIIDPFLPLPIAVGQRCWMFLYQNTVTGMRHEWAHPAFVVAAEPEEDDSDYDGCPRNCY